jgi:hypothetical protein
MRSTLLYALVVMLLTTASTAAAEERADAPCPPGHDAVLPYDPGSDVPRGYHLEAFPRKGLVIGGLITWGVSYGFSAIAARGSSSADGRSEPVRAWLYLPIAGPFIFAASRRPCPPDDPCDGQGIENVTMFTFGLVQLVGATLVGSGFVFPKTMLVRDADAAVGPLRLRASVVPMAAPGVFGISVSGFVF